MVIDEIDIGGIPVMETKDNPPVPTDGYAPESFEITGQRVKTKSRNGHVVGRFSCIQTGQDTFEVVDISGWQPPSIAVFKETFQSPIAKANDHAPV